MGKSKKALAEKPVARQIVQQAMEEVIHGAMMPYAEYVIMDRALPRVEDGLKPVQRRILYAMYDLSITPDKPHRKCARIVGDTLGKFHPHGDTSVYDALVRMAQDFNMGEILVDGHGNFGSMDGDSAAAMRYTEARLTPPSMEILRDIEKDTVHFSLNFDDTLTEPDVLPGRFPNLLVNGASGIAVGLATNIPPHNLGEVIDGVIAQIQDPKITLSQLMEIIKGPDFPTGGYMLSESEVQKAFETGRGRIVLRAKVNIENVAGGKKNIVITELPYQVNKATMLSKILKLSEEKKALLSGISDIRDESDRTGMRAVIEVKKDADADKILAYLYKYSDLQISFGVNMVAIADGKPQLLGLREMIAYYIEHQKNVVTRRTQYDLAHAKAREHILQGLIIAISNIDKVIAIIRSSKAIPEAKQRLKETFNLSEKQAQAILEMRLQRLTGLEILALEKEHSEVLKRIAELEAILASEKKLLKVIKDELLEIKKKYERPRRTHFIEEAEQTINPEELKVVEDVSVVITQAGYIKRISQKNGPPNGQDEPISVGFDPPKTILDSATDKKFLAFTSTGICYQTACEDIPDAKWKDKGVPFGNLVGGLIDDEKVVCFMPAEGFKEDAMVNFYTALGMVKRSPVSDYLSRVKKVQAISLKKGDCVVGVELHQENVNTLLITQKGMCICFDSESVSCMGRVTAGVKGIALEKGDQVIFARQIPDEGEVVIVSDKGYGKRVLAVDFDAQNRNGKGVKVIDFKKNGVNGTSIAAALFVQNPYDILFEQKSGECVRLNTEQIPIELRASKGKPLVFVMLDDCLTRVCPIK